MIYSQIIKHQTNLKMQNVGADAPAFAGNTNLSTITLPFIVGRV